MADTPKTGFKYALSFIGGAAIGAGLGLIFAPRTGKETRKIVGDWIEKKKVQGKDWVEKGKDEFVNKKEQVGAAFTAGKKAYYEETKQESKQNTKKQPVGA